MFKKMEYVYAVYKEQSFTKAAEKLYISQPCLSAAIKKLEDEIGMPLFERRYSTVRPTSIGLEYIETAEKIMDLERSFAAKVNNLQQLETGTVSVGGSNYVSSYILPRIVTAFSQKYPKINISLVESSSVELEKKIMNEELDLLIDSFDEEKSVLDCIPLLNEKILLAVPASFSCNDGLTDFQIHPDELCQEGACRRMSDNEHLPQVPISCFQNEKFILLKSGHNMQKHAAAVFREGNITPKVAFRLDQLLTSYALAATGNGVCFVTDTLFKYHRFRDDILLYNIAGSGSRTLSVAKKQNRYSTAAMECFIQIAKDVLTSSVC